MAELPTMILGHPIQPPIRLTALPGAELSSVRQTQPDDEVWTVWKLRCPGCGTVGEIDDDQVNGRVSLLCRCGWHETHNLAAYLEAECQG